MQLYIIMQSKMGGRGGGKRGRPGIGWGFQPPQGISKKAIKNVLENPLIKMVFWTIQVPT